MSSMIYDPETEIKLGQVCPDIAIRFKNVISKFWDKYELQLKVTQGYRTYAQQWEVYSQGRKKDIKGNWLIIDFTKIVTHARAGESFHNFGLGVDAAVMGPDPYLIQFPKDECNDLWNDYGKIVKAEGLEWGGDFKHPDRPHAQLSYGLSIHEIQILYEDKGIKGVWERCKTLSQCGMELV